MKTMRMAGTANANVQNQINVSLIFNYLRHNGESYRADVARNVGLSAPAVSRAIETLISQGYITESGTLFTNNGKKVARIIVNPDIGCVVAIDFMKGSTKLGCFDFLGERIHQSRDDHFLNKKNVIGDLVLHIQQFIAEVTEIHGSRLTKNVKALCLGIPCAVDTISGKTTGAWLYDFLVDLNLKRELEVIFEVPIFIENDIKLAAFAENRLGEGKKYRHLVYLDINNFGIGSGIILDNHIVRGAQGLAGEIGYSIVPGAQIAPGISPTGYLESHASLESITNRVLKRIGQGESSLLHNVGVNLSSQMVFKAAMAGDELSLSCIEESVDLLVAIIVNLILAVNPEIVVVGGDLYNMPGADELFLKPLKLKMVEVLPFDPPKVGFSELGADNCVRGAALFAVESILFGKYPFSVDIGEKVSQ